MGDRREVELGEVAEITVGPAFKSAEFTDDSDDVPLLRGINVGVGAISWDKTKYWPRGQLPDFTRYELQAGDIVLAMDRPWIEAGLKVATVKETDAGSLLVQRVARLRAADGLDQDFLGGVINAPEFASYLRRVTGGTSVPHISATDIGEFRLRLPPPGIQRRLGALRRAFDELIEINEQRIELLEDVAQSLYREWFVHFRFPGHLGVEMVDSELGPIPEGWEVRSIGDLTRRFRRTVKPAEQASTPFEHFSIPAFDEHRLPKIELGESIKSSKTTIEASCVLLAKLNPRIPRVWFVHEPGEAAITSTEFLPFAGNAAPDAWLWCAFSEPAFRSLLVSGAGGTSTSHQRFKRADVEGCRVPFHRGVVDDFAEVAKPVLEQAETLRRHDHALAHARDLLLPRLITGRLDISDLDLGSLGPTEAT